MNDRGPMPGLEEFRTYPLNSWYVGATSAEVGRSLLGRSILGEPVLFYRDEAGTVVALEDVCPHRAMPLSQGQLDGDCVVCGYHGFVFAANGDCVRAPSQERVPYGAKVRSYVVREEPPVVWVWLGDPAMAAEKDPPRLPWLHSEDYVVFDYQLHVEANYLALHDNSLDLTHFPYVHQELSPAGYTEGPPPLQVEVSEFSVTYSRTFPPGPLPEWQNKATGLDPNANYVLRESGSFVSPGVHLNHMDIAESEDRLDGPDAYRKPYVRGFTPEGPYSTHVFAWVARNYARDDSEVTEQLRGVHERLLREDKMVLETIQAHAARYYRNMNLTLVNADAAAVRAHEIVNNMLMRERGGRLHYRQAMQGTPRDH